MVHVKSEEEGIRYIAKRITLNGVFLNGMFVYFHYYEIIGDGVSVSIVYNFEPGTFFLYSLKKVLEYALKKCYLEFYEHDESTEKAERYALQKVFGNINFARKVEE
ncbi:MAG: hypothetical protein QXL94_02190 [Candidatus Parvarchaeum sp.]